MSGTVWNRERVSRRVADRLVDPPLQDLLCRSRVDRVAGRPETMPSRPRHAWPQRHRARSRRGVFRPPLLLMVCPITKWFRNAFNSPEWCSSFRGFPFPGKRRISKRQWKSGAGGEPEPLAVSRRNGVHSRGRSSPHRAIIWKRRMQLQRVTRALLRCSACRAASLRLLARSKRALESLRPEQSAGTHSLLLA